MSRSARGWLETAARRVWQTRNPFAVGLWPLSKLYGWVANERRHTDEAHAVHAGLPTIVVGNRIAGGAGKTPTVLAVLAHLQQAGWHPGVISRGHGGSVSAGSAGSAQLLTASARADQVGDEPALIKLRAQVPVAVGRDRAGAAALLRRAHPTVDIIVSDDGLQHRRLARDVEIVVFDGRGAGNGWLLPAGPLREPIEAASSAKALIVLYNAERASTRLVGHLAARALVGAVALDQWWRGEPADPATLRQLASAHPFACAGIARPESFFANLAAAGVPTQPIALPDHAAYHRLPWPDTACDVVVTEKDAIKLLPERVAAERPRSRVWVAPLDFLPSDAFFVALDGALARLR